MRQDVCFALIGGSSADGDRQLLTFARDDTKAVFGSLIVGMEGPDMWEKRVEDFVQRQAFSNKCLIMKWRITLVTIFQHAALRRRGRCVDQKRVGPVHFHAR